MGNGDRALEILFRAIKGEDISVRKLAYEHGVSTKSIQRDLSKIKTFLSENRDLTGNADLEYFYLQKAYRLSSDEFMTGKKLFAIAKAMLGTRAFSKSEATELIENFKKFVTVADKNKLNKAVKKELLHYTAVKHDCESVTDILWQLATVLEAKREITVQYYKMDRTFSY